MSELKLHQQTERATQAQYVGANFGIEVDPATGKGYVSEQLQVSKEPPDVAAGRRIRLSTGEALPSTPPDRSEYGGPGPEPERTSSNTDPDKQSAGSLSELLAALDALGLVSDTS